MRIRARKRQRKNENLAFFRQPLKAISKKMKALEIEI